MLAQAAKAAKAASLTLSKPAMYGLNSVEFMRREQRGVFDMLAMAIRIVLRPSPLVPGSVLSVGGR
jgi:hypothetical protein